MFKRYILQSNVTRVVANPCCSTEWVMLFIRRQAVQLGP
jgi:hypothetical protein